MAIPTLSGSYIDETYQRLVQVSGSEFADGLGNPVSIVISAQTASFVTNAQTGSFIRSTQTGSFVLNSQTGAFATTGSNRFIGNQNVNGNLIVSGNVTMGDSSTDSITINASTINLGDGNGIINIDNNTLYVNGAAGFVGIGTTVPISPLHVVGIINHNANRFQSLFIGVGPEVSTAVISFDPNVYYSCFVEYHVFLENPPAVSRAGNIRISVPHNHASLNNQYNIPFVETTTEYKTDPASPNLTTEDIVFKVNYDSGKDEIRLVMVNQNSSLTAYINAEYRLIGLISG